LIERFPAVEANQLVTIKEGRGISKSALPTMKGGSNPGQKSGNKKAPGP
jgi:enediyne biosynthesis protein E4